MLIALVASFFIAVVSSSRGGFTVRSGASVVSLSTPLSSSWRCCSLFWALPSTSLRARV